MERKIIFITGATNGIGKAAAMVLAKQGHTLILHGRSVETAKTTCDEIKHETGNNNIDWLAADLSLMKEVRQLADSFKQKYDRLDVLINNAGAQFGKNRLETAEGYEMTMATNLFAPFLLTNLLVDVLAKSPAARIITVSSELYRYSGKPYLNDIELKNKYTFSRAYGLSKLYVLWIMWHLIDVLKEKGINNITVNCLEPGVAKSGLGKVAKQSSFFIRAIHGIFGIFSTSREKGAQTTIYLASSEEAAGVTGKFFNSKKKIKNEYRKYYSKENAKTIWDYCMKETSKN